MKDCLTAALVAIWFGGAEYFLLSDDWRGIFVMFSAIALYKAYGEGSKWPAVVAILGMVAQVFWYWK